MTASSNNNNKTIITDETPNLGETGDILSDLKLTPQKKRRHELLGVEKYISPPKSETITMQKAIHAL